MGINKMSYEEFKAIIGCMVYHDHEIDNDDYNVRYYERDGLIGSVVYYYKSKVNNYSITYL